MVAIVEALQAPVRFHKALFGKTRKALGHLKHSTEKPCEPPKRNVRTADWRRLFDEAGIFSKVGELVGCKTSMHAVMRTCRDWNRAAQGFASVQRARHAGLEVKGPKGALEAWQMTMIMQNQGDFWPGLAVDVPAFCNLRKLQLRRLGLEDSGLLRVEGALTQLSALTALDLSCNSLTSRAAEAIGCWMANAGSLQRLCLGWNLLSDTGVVSILCAGTGLRSLQHLELHGNMVTSRGAEALAQGLAMMPRLRFLGLQHNLLGYEDMVGLAQAEAWDRALQISVHGNLGRLKAVYRLHPRRFPCFCPAYVVSPLLARLQSADIECKSDNVRLASQLTQLRCSPLTTYSAAVLTNAISKLTSLRALKLDGGIISGWVSQMCPKLPALRMLTSLQLRKGALSMFDSACLSEALKKMKQLERLQLEYCGIRHQHLELLLPGIVGLTNLQWLSLEGNKVGDSAATVLVTKARSVFPGIEQLNLKGNIISMKTRACFGASLKPALQW